MSIVFWVIVIGGFALTLFILSKTSKKKKANLLEKQKEETNNYKRYMSRFDDPSVLSKLDTQLCNVAGTRYANDDTGENRQDILKESKVGDLLMLLPDELNRYDDAAIKVVRLNGKQIGFLDMDISVEIKSRLMSGSPVEARIKRLFKKGSVIEAEIELQRYSRKIKK
ncbi:HIRAN domain-containing protein [Flammeovirga kamogawensis]|uniref:HIRAN domain-containing protein n=1 Tax=Flammeovirga kamogawensis TaxID=373891 RepID=A0ABX8GWV6_9BACT|nr:HIRAN domain-containing protein [Flammeovirga kamogawensis]MBB6460726.1 hypothetical protein [Flammeovirga kamogawensis]QWG08079.1 HIRAN domain-containing protein [Flammeovirga kamogawensis]TRX69882.1 hypothetical protein EO216_17780 [Flammeovirga kamogawensis]